MKAYIRNTVPYRVLSLLGTSIGWNQRDFAAPSPRYVKLACLLRNGISDAIWIETGTYRGQTTHALSKHASKVYSIEPEPTLFANAAKYFSTFKNVEIINGTSEQVFPELLPKITGSVNFWLDGHYTSAITYQGPQDTPIMDELRCISANRNHFDKICVLIDDVRCFSSDQYPSYPPLDELVDWARCEKLQWRIEHDIFCAKN